MHVELHLASGTIVQLIYFYPFMEILREHPSLHAAISSIDPSSPVSSKITNGEELLDLVSLSI